MSNSILTLDGPIDPFEPPPRNDAKPRVVDPGNYPVPRRTPKPKKVAKNPLPKNPKSGDCACRWNERKNRWVLFCFVGRGTGKGQTRSGWQIKANAEAFCARKPSSER